MAYLHLQHRALSGSGLQQGRHIIDPRNAQPVEGTCASWASTATATTADALSTAFMIMSPDEIRQYCMRHSQVLALVALGNPEERTFCGQILHFGPWKKDDFLE